MHLLHHEPFENWTRSATEIMGTVEFDVDFSVPFNEMRAELDRLLSESELWDGRRGVLQVTDAVGGMVRVRIVVSAPNAGALFDLRCAVREGMVDWVHTTGGCCRRSASSPPRPSPRPRAPPTATVRRRGWRPVCSPAAPRPMHGPGRSTTRLPDREDELARSNGRG